MIDVRVLDIQPHPDQATNNPGSWAVRFEVTYDGATRTFWRWHETYDLRDGRRIPTDDKPEHAEIIKRFWDYMFLDLYGFAFNKDAPW
jgi:hypothetical protein